MFKRSIYLGAVLVTVTLAAHAQTVSTFTCTPTGIGVGDGGTASERVVLTCSQPGANGTGGNTIFYFAIGTAAAEQAKKFLSIGSSALLSGRPIALRYNHTTTTSGCGSSNCRVPLDFTLQ